MTTALVVVDVQRGFSDPSWGRRGNPAFETRLAALLDGWRDPVVLVRHDSGEPGSPLAPGSPGNVFSPLLDGVDPALLVVKHVNSAFHGDPDLAAWLRREGIEEIVLAGIQTNSGVKTTARRGGNLGFAATVALDATATFDLAGPHRAVLTAEVLTRATATNLHRGGFAPIASVDQVLSASSASPA